ncbi:M28 family peptidase [Algoriphagus aquimarinus]|uniref:M28 family peptidase n=1 Tax=Algoriphagus aquimarinus TaxID=237018 RepID=A0A5C7AS85_9BACT|nr:M28 family peptidase [Algoriphagus aquimarinus]TXE08722.1 M28 family peptidase [Algoriphagus aquimarinus]|tara:strand:- start:450 stop:1748 length:1299 start_codon:yes stop_codon:yes gene_type:complete
MKKILLSLTILGTALYSCTPKIGSIINVSEVERIETVLSADDMKGRQLFTPELDKAADFIAAEFQKSGLEFFGGNDSYMQSFDMLQASPSTINGSLDQEALSTSNVTVNSTSESVEVKSLTDYELVKVAKDANFNQLVFPVLRADKNVVVLIDPAHAANFARLGRIAGRAKFPTEYSQVFIMTDNLDPKSLALTAKNTVTKQPLKNVVGVIPGKSRKDEYVVFGGHYDHIGIGRPDAKQDSIYNGANDNAAGTTAVMMLGKYFNELKDNERTLIFVAFTAEESGGFGSTYFSKQLDPDKVVAMFNIEMIGTDSKWGPNSAYITGFEKSSMGEILQKNLVGSKFHFEPDPYPKQNLFYRSDNRTLAELGVPAHTISTSKMEEAPNDEPNYHKASDEIGTLDMDNMTEVIKAIALSSKTIISGKDTPSRVEKLD